MEFHTFGQQPLYLQMLATPVLANVSFMPRTNKLAGELGKFKMGADSAFLTKLTRAIFSQHLDKYME